MSQITNQSFVEGNHAAIELNVTDYVKDGILPKTSRCLLRCKTIQIFESLLKADRTTAPSILWEKLMEVLKQRFPQHLHGDISTFKPPQFRKQVSISRDSNPSIEKLKYSPLQYNDADPMIRLIILLPAKEWSSEIECDLRQDMLETCSYEALSYVWGSAQDTVPIHINKKTFDITRNLEGALREFRLGDRPLALWVDAICINQRDNDEKSKQIQLMGKIYKYAKRVLVWLGPESNSVGKAFRFIMHSKWTLRELDSHQPFYNKTDLCYRGLCGDDSVFYQRPLWWILMNMGLGAPIYENGCKLEDMMCCVLKLLQRPWWRRIWVLQEISLSSTVLLRCGPLSTPWDQFTKLQSLLNEICDLPTPQDFSHPAAKYVDEWQWISSHLSLVEELGHFLQPLTTMVLLKKHHLTGVPLTLERLVNMTQQFQSTEPRDKIYALLSLINDEEDYGEIGIPNYEISIEALYTKVVKHLLGRTESPFLGLFQKLPEPSHAPGFVRKELSLPSWVPDFSRSSDTALIDMPSTIELAMFQHAQYLLMPLPHIIIRMEDSALDHSTAPDYVFRPVPQPFQVSEDLKFLTVHGVSVEQISALSDPCNKDIEASVESWKHKFIDIELEDQPYVRGGTVQEAYWYSIRAQQYYSRKHKHPRELLRAADGTNANYYPHEAMRMGESVVIPCCPHDTKSKFHIKGILSHDPPVCYTRRLFQTPKGLIGLGPGTMKCGDLIIMILGVRLPVILRKKGEVYEVIGASYVRLLEPNSLFRDWEMGDGEMGEQLQEFVLC